MSEHDDTQLDDFMDGKSSLNKIYRKGKQEEPSAELDARILAAASAAVSSSGNSEATQPPTALQRPKWLVPLSLAATVMLGVNLAYNLKDFSSTPEFEANGPTVMSEVGNNSPVISDQKADSDVAEDSAATFRDEDETVQKKTTERVARQRQMEAEAGGVAEALDQEEGGFLAANSKSEATQAASPPVRATSSADQGVDEVIVAESTMSKPEPVSMHEETLGADKKEPSKVVVTGSRIRRSELDAAAPQAAAAKERAYSHSAEGISESKERRRDAETEAVEAPVSAEAARTENDVAAFSPPPSAAMDNVAAPSSAMSSSSAAAPGITGYQCQRRTRSDGHIEQIIKSKASASPQQAELWLSEISALAFNEQVEIACLELEAFARRYGESAIPENFPVHLPD